ncbi:hypothetical protein ACFOLF_36980 [Paenibacillus sepulcri]|uniref:Polymer-forming cytoskeletal protein n=1 Tax=Paenibacillus sepulcri TaxID=359917 RepID=A0ABS7BVQ3_9BACL|nr:hypothetical protein [Paenibacillus sepulcri]
MMLLIPGFASAGSIFEHQNTNVPAGQTVNDVYVIGGDAEVFGKVTGAVVVINGSLHLGNTAHIKGVVVVIGGQVIQDPGAVVMDDVYDISLDNATQNSLLIGGGLVLGLWVLQLAGSLLMVLIPVLIRIIGRQKIGTFIDRYQGNAMGRLLYTGFLSGLIITAVSALLLITIIGIPILILVLLALIGAVAVGFTVLSYRIGEMVHVQAQRSEWINVLIGAAIITAFVNIPFVGWIVLLLVTLISFGIFTTWIAGKRKKNYSPAIKGE